MSSSRLSYHSSRDLPAAIAPLSIVSASARVVVALKVSWGSSARWAASASAAASSAATPAFSSVRVQFSSLARRSLSSTSSVRSSALPVTGSMTLACSAANDRALPSLMFLAVAAAAATSRLSAARSLAERAHFSCSFSFASAASFVALALALALALAAARKAWASGIVSLLMEVDTDPSAWVVTTLWLFAARQTTPARAAPCSIAAAALRKRVRRCLGAMCCLAANFASASASALPRWSMGVTMAPPLFLVWPTMAREVWAGIHTSQSVSPSPTAPNTVLHTLACILKCPVAHCLPLLRVETLDMQSVLTTLRASVALTTIDRAQASALGVEST